MPVPQENLAFVEQASCLLLTNGAKYELQFTLSDVEQASCLLLKMVQNVSCNLLSQTCHQNSYEI
jgi:hypothetical protein